MARLATVLVALACLTCAAPAAQAEVFAARTPIVFVLWDELALTSLETPQGQLDTRRYPGFAEFARTSTWFPNATTNGDGTRWAAPTLISGTFPVKSKMAAWFDHRTNLMSIFAPTHKVHALETVTRMCPSSECGREVRGASRGAKAHWLTNLIPQAKVFAIHHSPLADFIEEIKPWRGGQPPLYYAHAMMPHTPWVWKPNGKRYALPNPPLPGLGSGNIWLLDPDLVDQGWKRHLLQVGYADLLLRRLMARLKATGLWDRALVVLSADHGVAFHAGHSRRASTSVNIGGIAPIPLFIKLPEQRLARVLEPHVESVDVLPTMLDAVDEEAPPGLDGRSALSPHFHSRSFVSLWHATSTRGFGKRTYPLSLLFQQRRLEVTRQFVRFGSGPLTGRFWRDPFTPTSR